MADGKLEFLYELKLKDCDKVFKEGMNPGVLVSQKVSFPAFEADRKKPMFIKALMDRSQDFLDENVEVVITRVQK